VPSSPAMEKSRATIRPDDPAFRSAADVQRARCGARWRGAIRGAGAGTVKITGRPRGWLGVRYAAHESTGFRSQRQAPPVPAGDHRARGLALLPLRPALPGRGGAPRGARGARDRRDGPAMVPAMRAAGRQCLAPPSPSGWRHVASGRGLHAPEWGDALSLAGGGSGWQRARYPGPGAARYARGRAIPAQAAQRTGVCAARADHRQAGERQRRPARDPAACRAPAAQRGCTTVPRTRTSRPASASGGCGGSRARATPSASSPPTGRSPATAAHAATASPPKPIVRPGPNASPRGGWAPACRREPERRAPQLSPHR